MAVVVSRRRYGRRHPLLLATAALFAVLIAAPFTAPFSACSPSTLLAQAPDANPAIPSAAAVIARAVSSAAIGTLRPTTSSVTRAIPAVLRV
jgi:hypothetical protein